MSNEIKLTAEQEDFRKLYLSPSSPTFMNAKQSAIAAGYSEEYADTITTRGYNWMKEIIADANRLKAAERVFDSVMNDGDLSETSESEKRIALDAAKFVASRLGKHKYSERHEHTGAEGRDLPVPILSLNLKKEEVIEIHGDQNTTREEIEKDEEIQQGVFRKTGGEGERADQEREERNEGKTTILQEIREREGGEQALASQDVE